jgi:hypothetical protein
VVAVVVLVLLGGLIFRMNERTTPEAGQRPADATIDTTASPAAASSPTGDVRADIVARVRGMTGEILRVDRIVAKRMRWSDFEKVAHTGNLKVDDRMIWAVAVSGEIRPQFARGQTFSWGVYVIDAQTGDINGLNAGRENWPPYFDALPDQKP